MAVKYSVELTENAQRTYERIYKDAQTCLDSGDSSSSKITLFHMVEELLDRIIPHDPFAPERGLSGPLSAIFRVKKGRLRVCYAGSSKQHKIVILYISETPRKAGDVKDPYAIFTHLVMSGQYDQVLEDLGVRRPNRRAASATSFYLQ
jgi:mRNA-degrading endonuclease RelE of RelBE toxin-antitoxin system